MKSIKSILAIALIAITVGQASAQSKAEIRQEKQLARQTEVAQMLASGSYQFVARSANTSLKSKPYVTLTSPYSLTVTPEKITSHLPFYGQAYSAQIGSSGSPLTFESTDFKISSSEKTKKSEKTTTIKIEARSDQDSKTVEMTLQIGSQGGATLYANRQDLSRMSFEGEIQPIPEPRK